MRKVADTPLNEIVKIHEYFGNPANAPMLQMPSDKTLYVWENMCAFQPTLQVLRDGPISVLEEKEDAAIGKIAVAPPGASAKTVQEFFDASTMDALLVLRQGAVVFERYKTMRPFDKHQWFSSGKTIAGTLTALLAHEGKIDINKPVSHYLKELAGSAWDDVSVEATLDMATGLDSTEHDEQPVDDGRTNPKRGWFKWAVSIGLFQSPDSSTATPYDVLRGMRRVKPAYTAYEYNSIDTFVLERIVEAVTGKPITEVLSERAWCKMGASNDAYVGVNKYGLPSSWGMTSSVLRDLGRWGLLFSPSWKKVSKEQIVPDAVIDQIQTGGKPEIFTKGRYGQQLQALFPKITGLANRFQWDIVFPDGDFAKLGVGGQGLYVSPRKDAVVVWFSTGTQDDEHAALVLGRTIARSFGTH